MDKLKKLSDFCWEEGSCRFCNNNKMFESCPYKEEFTRKFLYEDYFAKCEHYSLDIDRVIDIIRKIV